MPRSRTAPGADGADALQQARTRARRRLVGATVLLGIGVIAFPLVFETQPRPVPVDIAIEIPRKDGLAPLPMPASAPSAIPAPAPEAAPAEPAAAPAAKPEPAPEPAAVAAPKPAPKPSTPAARPAAETPKPAPVADAARAKALLEGKPAAPAAADAGRFVVQVGAFADAASARETRLRVEKLGLKTYTQVAETASGSRIRVRLGPFNSREEAEKVLGRTKAAGIDGVVLTL
jgi:DedD protein